MPLQIFSSKRVGKPTLRKRPMFLRLPLIHFGRLTNEQENMQYPWMQAEGSAKHSEQPAGEPLCAVHHGFQVRLNEDRIKCTTVGCSNMALSNGLCKTHTHSPREPRMDLRLEYVDARTDKLKEILGPVLKNSRDLTSCIWAISIACTAAKKR